MSIEIQKNTDNNKTKKYLDYVFEKIDIEGHEEVFKITNKKTGLLAIIAIHNTKLGGALGGTRIKSYASFEDALEDVLRLSKGMTYKSAIAEVGFGGGKSVIIIKDPKDKTKELLHSFGQAVDYLNGKYICAEDMGCTPQDAMEIQKHTRYVVGLPHEKSSGNPSQFTAWGVYKGIQATLKKLYNNDSVKDRTIAIQGVGSVGLHLMNFLFWQGAKLIISDVDNKKLKELAPVYSAKIVGLEDIYKQECDIFAPCAIGGTINDETIEMLKCKAVCGSANNQLLDDRHADILKDKNILYAPDFVVNAGGLLNVSLELDKEGYSSIKSRENINKIYDEINEIYKIAEENNISTNQAAIKLAQYKVDCGIGIRKDRLYFHHFE